MIKCKICNKGIATDILKVCKNCIKNNFDKAFPFIEKAFEDALKLYDLPPFPPKDKDGIICNNCSNNCKIKENRKGYCGLRINKNGKIINLAGNKGLLTSYLDPHPTNCVATWCCAASGSGYPKYSLSKERPEYGYYNLSIFMAACSMHCLFCQNYQYLENTKGLRPLINVEELINEITNRVTCLCFFGGCVVPQLDFVLRVCREIRDKSIKENRILRLCSETNGLENNRLLKKFAELSLASGGGIKFDLKTFNENLSIALSGTSNKAVYKNFESLAEFNKQRKEPPFLRVSTLLIPHYIDKEEIAKIARFIGDIDKNIPYSLLAFYPNFMFSDLPTTSRKLAEDCLREAKKYLNRVHIGNIHLLS